MRISWLALAATVTAWFGGKFDPNSLSPVVTPLIASSNADAPSASFYLSPELLNAVKLNTDSTTPFETSEDDFQDAVAEQPWLDELSTAASSIAQTVTPSLSTIGTLTLAALNPPLATGLLFMSWLSGVHGDDLPFANSSLPEGPAYAFKINSSTIMVGAGVINPGFNNDLIFHIWDLPSGNITTVNPFNDISVGSQNLINYAYDGTQYIYGSYRTKEPGAKTNPKVCQIDVFTLQERCYLLKSSTTVNSGGCYVYAEPGKATFSCNNATGAFLQTISSDWTGLPITPPQQLMSETSVLSGMYLGITALTKNTNGDLVALVSDNTNINLNTRTTVFVGNTTTIRYNSLVQPVSQLVNPLGPDTITPLAGGGVQTCFTEAPVTSSYTNECIILNADGTQSPIFQLADKTSPTDFQGTMSSTKITKEIAVHAWIVNGADAYMQLSVFLPNTGYQKITGPIKVNAQTGIIQISVSGMDSKTFLPLYASASLLFYSNSSDPNGFWKIPNTAIFDHPIPTDPVVSTTPTVYLPTNTNGTATVPVSFFTCDPTTGNITVTVAHSSGCFMTIVYPGVTTTVIDPATFQIVAPSETLWAASQAAAIRIGYNPIPGNIAKCIFTASFASVSAQLTAVWNGVNTAPYWVTGVDNFPAFPPAQIGKPWSIQYNLLSITVAGVSVSLKDGEGNLLDLIVSGAPFTNTPGNANQPGMLSITFNSVSQIGTIPVTLTVSDGQVPTPGTLTFTRNIVVTGSLSLTGVPATLSTPENTNVAIPGITVTAASPQTTVTLTITTSAPNTVVFQPAAITTNPTCALNQQTNPTTGIVTAIINGVQSCVQQLVSSSLMVNPLPYYRGSSTLTILLTDQFGQNGGNQTQTIALTVTPVAQPTIAVQGTTLVFYTQTGVTLTIPLLTLQGLFSNPHIATSNLPVAFISATVNGQPASQPYAFSFSGSMPVNGTNATIPTSDFLGTPNQNQIGDNTVIFGSGGATSTVLIKVTNDFYGNVSSGSLLYFANTAPKIPAPAYTSQSPVTVTATASCPLKSSSVSSTTSYSFTGAPPLVNTELSSLTMDCSPACPATASTVQITANNGYGTPPPSSIISAQCIPVQYSLMEGQTTTIPTPTPPTSAVYNTTLFSSAISGSTITITALPGSASPTPNTVTLKFAGAPNVVLSFSVTPRFTVNTPTNTTNSIPTLDPASAAFVAVPGTVSPGADFYSCTTASADGSVQNPLVCQPRYANRRHQRQALQGAGITGVQVSAAPPATPVSFAPGTDPYWGNVVVTANFWLAGYPKKGFNQTVFLSKPALPPQISPSAAADILPIGASKVGFKVNTKSCYVIDPSRIYRNPYGDPFFLSLENLPSAKNLRITYNSTEGICFDTRGDAARSTLGDITIYIRATGANGKASAQTVPFTGEIFEKVGLVTYTDQGSWDALIYSLAIGLFALATSSKWWLPLICNNCCCRPVINHGTFTAGNLVKIPLTKGFAGTRNTKFTTTVDGDKKLAFHGLPTFFAITPPRKYNEETPETSNNAVTPTHDETDHESKTVGRESPTTELEITVDDESRNANNESGKPEVTKGSNKATTFALVASPYPRGADASFKIKEYRKRFYFNPFLQATHQFTVLPGVDPETQELDRPANPDEKALIIIPKSSEPEPTKIQSTPTENSNVFSRFFSFFTSTAETVPSHESEPAPSSPPQLNNRQNDSRNK